DQLWPVQRWVQPVHSVRDRIPEATLVLQGEAAEVPLIEQMGAAAGLTCVGSASAALRPLFALCEIAHSMISADSGPAHSAAALAVPLVVLYGTQSPRVWLPRSSGGSPVIAVGGPPQVERVGEISVESVYAAWCSLDDAA